MTPTLFNAFKSINTFVFLVISGLHFYWALAGLFGATGASMTAVVPEVNGKPLFKPTFWATVFVAVALLVCAFLSIWGIKPVYKGTGALFVSEWWCVYGNLAIAFVFLLRAVGDFKYVGFFKSVIGTAFARNDTRFYSPLCLLISAIAFYIYWSIRY